MFKNAITYLVTPVFCLNPEILARFPARPCAPHESRTMGFTAPCNHSTDKLAHHVSGYTPICQIPPTAKMVKAGFNKFKTANLGDAYRHFTGKELENAHSAMADVLACRDVYFAIQDMHGAKAA